MAALGELVVSLTANTAKFTEGLNKANFQAQKTFNQMKSSIGGIGTAIAGAFSVGAIVAFAQKAVVAADAINDVAKANDVAVSSVLRLSQALNLNGGEADSAGRLFSSLTNKIDEAVEGSDKAQESFKKAGVTLDDLAKLDAQVLFEKTLQGLAKIEDPIKRNAMAMDIFGKAAKGVDITGLAQDYASSEGEFKNAEEAFKQIGTVMDELDKFTMNASIAFAENLAPALAGSISIVNEAIFGWGELEKNIRAANKARRDASAWKETAPLITDKPQKGMFNFGEYAADEVKRVVQAGAEAEKAAKELAKKNAEAREKALKEANEAEVKRLNVAIWVNEQIYKKEKETLDALEEARGEIIAEWVEKQKEFNAEVEKVKDAVDPTREYTRNIELLGKMFDMGRISAEEFSKAAEMAQKEMLGFSNKTEDSYEELKDAINGYTRDLAKDFTDMAISGEISFKKLAADFAASVTQMYLQKAILDPLFKSFEIPSVSSGSSGGFFDKVGGFFSSLLPSFDVGSDYVPRDMIAKIHEGERILTKEENKKYGKENFNQSNFGQQQIVVKNINVLDPSLVGNYLRTDDGERIIMNTIQRNRAAFGM